MNTSLTPLLPYIRNVGRFSHLIRQLVAREFHQRYRGTLFGTLWSLLTPLFMLGLYNFVFGTVFQSRWPQHTVDIENPAAPFVTILFVGMIIYGLFAEVIGRAPSLIISQPNFVNKVIFPLELLPLVSIINGLINMILPTCLLLCLFFVLTKSIPVTILLFPIVLVPYLIFLLGLVFIISSLGVYLRDLSQIIGLIITVSLFAAPVFYPLSAVPEPYRPWLYLNPVTFILEQSREILLFGHLPNWMGIALYTVIALLIASLGLALFQRLRGGFADVL